MPNARIANLAHPRRPRRLGPIAGGGAAFTFIEVLFAIIILGIGMIMIAGILPVAIKQTSDTRDEVTGRAVVQAGFAYMRSAIDLNPAVFTPTATVNGFDPNGPDASPTGQLVGRVVPLTYNYVLNNYNPQATVNFAQLPNFQGSRIYTSDPRFQWLAFYRRDAAQGPNNTLIPSSSIQVTVLAMRLHNSDAIDHYNIDNSTHSTLDKEADPNSPGAGFGNGPYKVLCRIYDGIVTDSSGTIDRSSVAPDHIVFTGTNNNQDDFDLRAAGSGAFVIINHSPAAAGDTQRPYRNNGRVFRLGQRRADLDTSFGGGRVWELVPGYDLGPGGPGPDNIMGTGDDARDTSFEGQNASAWMVGRGRSNPTADADTVDTFDGLPQDVMVLSGTIPVY